MNENSMLKDERYTCLQELKHMEHQRKYALKVKK